jgi:hypothetical protein
LRFHAAQLARIRAALQREEAGAQRSEWKNETAKSEVSFETFFDEKNQKLQSRN